MESRRTFSREFNLQAVKLVVECGVSSVRVPKDQDVHENLLRKRGELRQDPLETFSSNGKQKAQDTGIARLRIQQSQASQSRHEIFLAALFYQRFCSDVLNPGRPTSRRNRCEVRLRDETPGAWPVNLMCKAPGGLSDRFYAWRTRPRSQLSLSDEVLGAQVGGQALCAATAPTVHAVCD